MRLTGLLLIVSLLVMLAAATAARATSRAAARSILGRAIPEITDFDHTFAAHFVDLQAAASTPAGVNGVTLTGYPVNAPLAANEVNGRTATQVRALLLLRSADAVYDHGTSAFAGDTGSKLHFASYAPLSAPWTFAIALHVVNPGFHARALAAAKVTLVAAAMLAIVMLALSQGYNRTVMYGVALLAAALPALALAALLWLGITLVFGSSSDPLVAGTYDLLRSLAWYGVLSYIVYCATAVALLLVGLLLERAGDAVARHADPAARREFER